MKHLVKEKNDHALVLVYAIKKDSNNQNLKDLASFVEDTYWSNVDGKFIGGGQTQGENDELHGKYMTYARRIYEKWHEDLKVEKQLAELAELEVELMASNAKQADLVAQHKATLAKQADLVAQHKATLAKLADNEKELKVKIAKQAAIKTQLNTIPAKLAEARKRESRKNDENKRPEKRKRGDDI